MAYIGSTPTTQSFIAGTDTFSGTGSQTVFALSRPVNTSNDILVVVNNVEQQPSEYTVLGSTLTISAAPSSGTNNVYVRYLSTTLQSAVIVLPTLSNALTAGTGLTANAAFNGSAAVTFNATGSTINSQTGAYVLVAGDAGKTISITTGGVTVPNSIFSAGNIITIYNNSGSSQTITQGAGVTLQWAGQTTSITGNRALGLYGIATLIYITPSVAVISGAGLT
jgi:hypothetical protein